MTMALKPPERYRRPEELTPGEHLRHIRGQPIERAEWRAHVRAALEAGGVHPADVDERFAEGEKPLEDLTPAEHLAWIRQGR
jgi:hypothetical protein